MSGFGRLRAVSRPVDPAAFTGIERIGTFTFAGDDPHCYQV